MNNTNISIYFNVTTWIVQIEHRGIFVELPSKEEAYAFTIELIKSN